MMVVNEETNEDNINRRIMKRKTKSDGDPNTTLFRPPIANIKGYTTISSNSEFPF